MIKTISITNSDILKHLEKQGNQSSYMCQLISKDMCQDERVSIITRQIYDLLSMLDKVD